MAVLRSMHESIEKFAAEGYQFPESLSLLPGRVISMAGTLFYVNAEPIVGYPLAEARTKLARIFIGQLLGRGLKSHESVKFKTPDHKDFRLSNLRVYSRDMSARELYECNQEPVLGYSHCLCKCGKELDLLKQKETPYAYFEGHSPADKRRKQTIELSTQIGVKQRNKKAKTDKSPRQPTEAQTLKIQEDLKNIQPEESVITPETEQVLDLERERFRPVFMAAIEGLPWSEFEELLECLLKIKERKKNG